MRRTTSAEGTTSSMRQPFELPTSMYSMKRAMWPLERQRSAIGRMSRSLTPRFTTMLTFTGERPAAAAASMLSSTFATGKSTSFMARKVASSSESRLTVTRSRPACARACAFLARSEPLVVKVSSTSSSSSIATRRWRSRRTSGSPPVRRGEDPPHQRLASREADLLHAQADEDARQPRDLLEAEDGAVRQERVTGVEHLARHAVHAAEVAAVGDRDAQVVHRAPERVT